MGIIQMKNVPDDLHDELRRRARRSGMTVRDYVIALIARDQRRPTLEEWLEEIAMRTHPSESASLRPSGPGGPRGARAGARGPRWRRAWRQRSLMRRSSLICCLTLLACGAIGPGRHRPLRPRADRRRGDERDRPRRFGAAPPRGARPPRRCAGLPGPASSVLPLAPAPADAWELRRRPRAVMTPSTSPWRAGSPAR